MNQDPVTVDRIRWLKILPDLHLLKAFPLGLRLRTVIPAAVLTAIFFWLTSSLELQIRARDLTSMIANVALPTVVTQIVKSMVSILTGNEASAGYVGLLVSCPLLALVLPAVARATSQQFCRSTRCGVFASLKHSLVHFKSTLVATGLAIIIVAAPLLALKLVSLVSTIVIPAYVIALAWPFVALLGFLVLSTASVVLTGWLLSLAAIGTDSCTGSDALSRGINYILSHKTRALLYLTVTVGLSQLAAIISQSVLLGVNHLLAARLPETFVKARVIRYPDDAKHQIVGFWAGALEHIPHVVQLSVFLCGITLAYLLLRQTEDAVELREVDGAAPGLS